MKDKRDAAILEKILVLRAMMKRKGLMAIVITSTDPHLSECCSKHWQFLNWISGFTGSTGTLVFTHEEAALWVDSRYWLQAIQELPKGGEITLIRIVPNEEDFIDWLSKRLHKGDVLTIDGNTCSLYFFEQMQERFCDHGIILRTDINPIIDIWLNRPNIHAYPIEPADPAALTSPRKERISEIARLVCTAGAQWHFLSSLDDIAWIFDLRGRDFDYNPVFLAHALLDKNGNSTLFVVPGAISSHLSEDLRGDGIKIENYHKIQAQLTQLPNGTTLLCDAQYVVVSMIKAAIGNLSSPRIKIVNSINPSTLLKSRKTPQEIAKVRYTMIEDGIALCEFFAWLDTALSSDELLTELSIKERLDAYRTTRSSYVFPSFPTIVAFNSNGALPHYHATTESNTKITGNGLLLIDSGGQYRGGTTDITRMVGIGIPSIDQKRDCALVLKSIIALSNSVFPDGLHAPMLDAIARAPLWNKGINYGHSTGHGVGFFLNVHERPQSISCYAKVSPHNSMRQGMITSIEPGIYREGKWGVRIENLVVTIHGPITEFDEFLSFETLTLCPIDVRCIDLGLLVDSERRWLNNYHKTVRTKLKNAVRDGVLSWLIQRTEPV